MTSSFRSPGEDYRWRAGLTLAERLVALNDASPRNHHSRSTPRKKTRWRLERRGDIACVGDLQKLKVNLPPWLQTFRDSYDESAQQKRSPYSSQGFLGVVEPVIDQSRQRIAAAIRGQTAHLYPSAKDDQSALVTSLEHGLRERLYNCLSKALVLELAVAHQRKVLAGKNSEERFTFFCECLAESAFARALLAQYPVLIRRIVTMIGNWEIATLALLSRLSDSRKTLLEKFFGDEDPGPLMSADATGDTHRRGQAVHLLRFAAGHRLVYKPRSVALERCYFDLTAWFNRNGYDPDLKEVRTFDEGRFGWMEFVDARPCETFEQVERFFVRQGAQLALCYLLGGTDLHFENVIAHGEYPALVDLETLFQSTLLPDNLPVATAVAWRTLQRSVVGTLLLPQPLFLAGNEHWVDLSALGYHEGQLTPFRLPVWRGDGTDQMRIQHKRLAMQGGVSLPEYEGKRVPATQHTRLFLRGLQSAYELMRSRRVELLAETGPLAAAFGKPARHVFRGTEWYARLLDASYHPSYLEDSIVAEAFLRDRLRADSSDTPWLSAIEDAEVSDLLAGDIPYFASEIGAHAPIAASAEIDFALPGNGWNEARARLAALSDADLERQLTLANVAMIDLDTPTETTPPIRPEPSRDATPEELITTAAGIGDRLCDLALTDGGYATWLFPKMVDKSRLINDVAGFDLYSGLSGIALFLGHLGATSGNGRYSRVAAAAIAEALALYRKANSEELSIGAYDGIGGFAYAIWHLGNILDRPEWVVEATEILKKTARRAARSPQVDIISGQAGFTVAALSVYRRTKDVNLLHALSPSANRLYNLASSVRRRGRLSLPAKADAGLAHGQAGIGFALLRWSEATGENHFLQAAKRLFEFDFAAVHEMPTEHSHDQKIDFLGWCRGWLGAALVALEARSIVPNQTSFQHMADEIVRFGVEGALCMCHGALARLEFMTAMADQNMLVDQQLVTSWRRRLIARILAGEWVSDTTHHLESPGLMLGLAGTGYAMLRAARPKSVPSMLTLE